MFFRVLDKGKQLVDTDVNAYQLTAKEGTHSLVCRAQRGVNSAMQHLAWVLLGKFFLILFRK